MTSFLEIIPTRWGLSSTTHKCRTPKERNILKIRLTDMDLSAMGGSGVRYGLRSTHMASSFASRAMSSAAIDNSPSPGMSSAWPSLTSQMVPPPPVLEVNTWTTEEQAGSGGRVEVQA